MPTAAPGVKDTPVFGEDADEPCALERERASARTGLRTGLPWEPDMGNAAGKLVMATGDSLRQQGKEQTAGWLLRLRLQALGVASQELSQSCGGRPGCPQCQPGCPQWPPGQRAPRPGLWPPSTMPQHLLCFPPAPPILLLKSIFWKLKKK